MKEILSLLILKLKVKGIDIEKDVYESILEKISTGEDVQEKIALLISFQTIFLTLNNGSNKNV